MKELLIIFLILFSLTGITLFQMESVIITPFHIFSVFVGLVTIMFQKQHLPCSLKYILVIFISIIFSIVINYKTFIGLNTFIHSSYYLVIYCIVLINLKNITLEMFITSSKIIISIYFACVILAFISVNLHLNNSFINEYFGIVYDTKYLEFRYYGFSSEPSYMDIIVSFIMFSMVIINETSRVNKISLIFAMYVVLIILSKSGYGYIFLILISLFKYGKYINKKYAFIIVILLIILYSNSNIKYDGRFLKLVSAIISNSSTSSKLEAWNIADSSSYFRIGPSFWFMENMDVFSIKTIFGFGMGADREFFYKFSPGYNFGYLNLGIIPAFIYTNGIFLFSFLLYYVLRILKVINSNLLAFAFFIILFNCGFATQIFWFVISLITILANLCEKNRLNKTAKAFSTALSKN